MALRFSFRFFGIQFFAGLLKHQTRLRTHFADEIMGVLRTRITTIANDALQVLDNAFKLGDTINHN